MTPSPTAPPTGLYPDQALVQGDRDAWVERIKSIRDPLAQLTAVVDELEWAQVQLRALRATAADRLAGEVPTDGGKNRWAEAARQFETASGRQLTRQGLQRWATWKPA